MPAIRRDALLRKINKQHLQILELEQKIANLEEKLLYAENGWRHWQKIAVDRGMELGTQKSA